MLVSLTVILTMTILAISFLAVTGCDEAVTMTNGIITEPVEPTQPGEPTTNGEVKKPEEPGELTKPVEPAEPTEPVDPEPEPTPQPKVTITAAAQQDDGSVMVSGTSANVPAGATVMVTLGDTVTATATTDSAGAWTVTVPATDAEKLVSGMVTVIASVANATVTGTVEYAPVDPEEQQREEFRKKYEQYGLSEEAVERLVYRDMETVKVINDYDAGKISLETYFQKRDRLDEEAYGIPIEYFHTLLKIYVAETGEKHLLRGWNLDSVGIAYLTVKKEANPDASIEEIEEMFRKSAREGAITITGWR